MTPPPLRAAIDALLTDALDVILARSILGTTDAAAIAERVETFVRGELGAAVVGCPLFIQSVGAVFVLDLAGGSRIVVKAHRFDADRLGGFSSLAELEGVYEAQQELWAAGFPCARVLRGPRPFADGAAAIMSFLPAPPLPDAHAPEVRRALARELARSVELGRALRARDRLRRMALPAAVFPAPHNALFDFQAPGGEWIDARARAARASLDAGGAPPVVMHGDFSCANVIVDEGRVVAVFDMDSLCWTDELRCLGSAAVHFTYTGGPSSSLPTRDEARAFVADYLEAAGRSLTARERARLDAAAIYALAYTTRCAYEPGVPGPMDAALAAAPDAYFSDG